MEHNTEIAEKTEPAQAKTIRELLPKDETVYELA